MKELPYPEKPVFLCYHSKAFPFGIIQANARGDMLPWLCSKSAGCIYNPLAGEDKFDLDIEDQWGDIEGITVRNPIRLSKETSKESKIDLIRILVSAIDDGCYIRGMFNEKYIPQKQAFGRHDYMHDFLIIGYGDGYFISAGYIDSGYFRRFEIPFEYFIKSIYNSTESAVHLESVSYNSNFLLKPNTEKMISDLKKYINSSVPKYAEEPYFGISALMAVRECFRNSMSGRTGFIDRRYTRVLLEHEWVLNKIAELFTRGNLKSNFISHSLLNYNKARTAHMLGLKASATQRVDSAYGVLRIIDEIIADEMDYVPEMTENIETLYKHGGI